MKNPFQSPNILSVSLAPLPTSPTPHSVPLSLSFFFSKGLASYPPFIIYVVAAYAAALLLYLLRRRAASLPRSSSSSFFRAFSPDCQTGAIASAVCSALVGSNSVLLGKTAVCVAQNHSNQTLPPFRFIVDAGGAHSKRNAASPPGRRARRCQFFTESNREMCNSSAAASVGGDISSWRLTAGTGRYPKFLTAFVLKSLICHNDVSSAGIAVLLLWVVHIVYWLVNINTSLKR